MAILTDDLVSAEWLNEHLGQVQVVDIRGYVKSTDLGGGKQHAEYTGAKDEYEAGHIPGAVYVDWTQDIVDPDAEVKAQIAPPGLFAERMAVIGVGDDTDVVVVDHAGGHFATRLWWALRYYGHTRVAILDGGYKGWTAAGYPLTTDVPDVEPVTFTPKVQRSLRSEAGDVMAAIASKDRQIVDARDAGQ
jgi:thiosulfate/3-mercaptopyruvate sulfurtransferase